METDNMNFTFEKLNGEDNINFAFEKLNKNRQ